MMEEDKELTEPFKNVRDRLGKILDLSEHQELMILVGRESLSLFIPVEEDTVYFDWLKQIKKAFPEIKEDCLEVTRPLENGFMYSRYKDEVLLVKIYLKIDKFQSERTRLHEIRDIIKKLEEIHENGALEREIINEAGKKGIYSDRVRKVLEKMRRNGMIYMPKEGWYKFS